jgi:folate-binding protein YgfZ
MILVFTTLQVYVLPPMPDNPNPVFALEGQRLLALEGPDAVRFAHAQFMSDVAGLGDGQWQWSGWLAPKGRVLALFALLRLDAQRVWLLLPDADPEALAAQLRRFLFRSKLAIAARPDLSASGAFAAHAQASGATIAMEDAGSIALDAGGDGGPRTLWIAPSRTGTDATMGTDAVANAAWRASDLAHGLPRLGDDQVDRWTPQQLSLDRLRAYSVKKGCYPGQEIVARTHFLGQAKRGLVLLEGDAPLAPGGAVHVGDAASGNVACTAGMLALAVLPLERGAAAAITVDGAVVCERPLLGGLAR